MACANRHRAAPWLVGAFVFMAVLPAALGSPVAPRIPKRVGVLPFRTFLVTPASLFRAAEVALPGEKAAERATAYIVRRLAMEPDIVLANDTDLRQRLTAQTGYREGILLAREWFNLGVDHYRALRLERARENLQRAETLYLDVFQDVVEPFALAELELYLGLTHAELGATELAHVAFKRMLALDPGKRFAPGFHAETTEALFRAALVDLLLTGDRDLALHDPARTDRFLTELELDTLVYGHVSERADGATVLRVVVSEGGAGRTAYVDDIVLTGDDSDTERLDRFVTRWLSCTTWLQAAPAEPTPLGLFVDIGVAESFYAAHPTRRLYHNLGFAASLAYQFAMGFDVFLSAALFTTFSDVDRDLFRATTNGRIVAGVGFVFRKSFWRLTVHPGVEVSYLGTLSWTKNPHCKFFYGMDPGEVPDVCPADSVESLTPPFQVGVNLTVGSDFFVSEGLYLALKAGFSSYFAPKDHNDRLNFPFQFTLGIGYAF